MSWPLLPVPMTSARLPFQASPSSYWLECRTVPREISQRRDVREVRNAAHAGRHDDVPRMHLALACRRRGAASTDQRCSSVVVGAALEFGAGPVVELHAFDIGLEPAGELVLRDVGRPVRRERHVRQVVDLHLVVQGERVVALAPVVADARPRGRRSACRPAAASGARRSKVRPVRRRRPAPPGRDRRSRPRPSAGRASWDRGNRASTTCLRPRAADVLLEALQFVERGQERPRFRLAVGFVSESESQDAAAAPK